MLCLSPHLNTEKLRKEFLLDTRIKIANVLPLEQCNVIHQFMFDQLRYDQALILDNQPSLLPQTSINRLTRAEFDSLVGKVYDNAAKGIGFWYGRAPDSEMSKSLLVDFNHWLKSKAVLDFIKQVTGQLQICDVVVQYTRYLPGDFLTRHRDEGAQGTRKIAFVFHFSPNWHPDWGGLLQFYQQTGQPRDAWAPEFGCLHLFDTQHIHAVTTISPFAPSARYTISGWFISQ